MTSVLQVDKWLCALTFSMSLHLQMCKSMHWRYAHSIKKNKCFTVNLYFFNVFSHVVVRQTGLKMQKKIFSVQITSYLLYCLYSFAVIFWHLGHLLFIWSHLICIWCEFVLKKKNCYYFCYFYYPYNDLINFFLWCFGAFLRKRRLASHGHGYRHIKEFTRQTLVYWCEIIASSLCVNYMHSLN